MAELEWMAGRNSCGDDGCGIFLPIIIAGQWHTVVVEQLQSGIRERTRHSGGA